jgi:hypothetical protein
MSLAKKIDASRHSVKWNSGAGNLSRDLVTWVALRLLRASRMLLRWSLGRCSWCGGNPGFSSTVSHKGLRCDLPDRKCSNIEGDGVTR